MIQIINLIQDQEKNPDIKVNNDIEKIFLMEFFQFIGCIVNDFNNPFGNFVNSNLTQENDQYSNNIETFLNIDQIKQSMNSSNDFINDSDNYGLNLLYKCIENIWDDSALRSEIKSLADIFTNSKLYYYFYNLENLISARTDECLEDREKCCDAALNSFIDSYNELKEQYDDNSSEYLKYSVVYMKHMINSITNTARKGNIFDIDIILKEIESIKNRNQNFYSLYCLEGEVCKSDTRYWYHVENCYLTGISKLCEQHIAKNIISFWYYNIGNFHGNQLHDKDTSKKYYNVADDLDKSAYRLLYKKLTYAHQEHKWDAMIDYANEIIALLMNGHEINQIMPKQQKYAYNSCIMLGDAYFEKEIFDLANRAYNLAININNNSSIFFDNNMWVDSISENESFKSVFKSLIPVQPVKFKVKSCLSKGDNHIIKF